MIARILERDPDWSRLPAATPPALRVLLARCLTKDVRQRLRDVGDVRLELERAMSAPRGAATRAVPTRAMALAFVAALLAGAAAALVLTNLSGSNDSRPTHVSIAFPPALRVYRGYEPGDGNWIGVAAEPRDTVGHPDAVSAYVRRFDTFEMRKVPGTEGATNDAASPDRRWAVFNVPADPMSGKRRAVRVMMDGQSPPVDL